MSEPRKEFKPNRLQNIFSMFSPGDEVARQSLPPGSFPASTAKLQDLLVNTSSTRTVERLKDALEGLYSNVEIEEARVLNRQFSFYSTVGPLKPQSSNLNLQIKSPYMWSSANKYKNDGKDGNNVGSDIKFHQIIGIPENSPELNDKKLAIVMSRNPYVAPAARNVSHVETFLNFMPTLVMSRCVPYLDVEFVFDRPNLNSADDYTETPGLLKFLMGGRKVGTGFPSADLSMHSSRRKQVPAVAEAGGETGSPPRAQTTMGMEAFTSPQTLVNLDPATRNANRYIGILDPLQPFMTIEGLTINVKGTTGVMSHKTATLELVLHDRSRMSEIADFIQPAAYGRTTLWLTYGWRHPVDEAVDMGNPRATETYAQFINNKMIMKEAYGIVNVSFSFDNGGPVKVTLSLFTKSTLEIRTARLSTDDDFSKLIRQQRKLSDEILAFKQRYKIEQPEGVSKEIRAISVIEGAASGEALPNLKPKEVNEAIENFFASFGSMLENSDASLLKDRLKTFYFGPPNSRDTSKFAFKEQTKATATNWIKSKFKRLNTHDPFLPYGDKVTKMFEEFGIKDGQYPCLTEILSFQNSLTANLDDTQKITTATYEEDIGNGKVEKVKLEAKLVSFGKLFSVFVLPAVCAMDFVEECQVFFYNINDYAGHASGINIAEFPIDLPEFLRRYSEVIASNCTTDLSVEQFVQIAVDSQMSDLQGVPFGFRGAEVDMYGWGLFKKFDPEKPNSVVNDKKEAQFAARGTFVNKGRGGFQLPQIEVIVEMTGVNETEMGTVDLLKYYSWSGLEKMGKSSAKQLMKIHIFDRCQNPYYSTAKIIASKAGAGYHFSNVYETYDPFKTREGPFLVEVKAGAYGKKPAQVPLEQTDEQKRQGDATRSHYSFSVDMTAKDRDTVRQEVARTVPTLTPGFNASSILEASVSTQSDALLASAQMLGANMGRNTTVQPRGDGIPGLPLRVIPTTMTLRTLGCPLVSFAQMFFVDMNTGTSIDNIYGVTSVTHTLAPGKFDTSLSLSPYDAYGKYEAAITIIDQLTVPAEAAAAPQASTTASTPS